MHLLHQASDKRCLGYIFEARSSLQELDLHDWLEFESYLALASVLT